MTVSAPSFICCTLCQRIPSSCPAGYKVVIMSNQKGVQSGKTKLSDVTGRFEQIARSAAIPMQMMFATGDSFYRKPCIGMWHQLATKLNGGVAIDMTKSFYIGDAAARPASAGRKKDFSGGDLKFALNLGGFTLLYVAVVVRVKCLLLLPQVYPSKLQSNCFWAAKR